MNKEASQVETQRGDYCELRARKMLFFMERAKFSLVGVCLWLVRTYAVISIRSLHNARNKLTGRMGTYPAARSAGYRQEESQ